MIFACFVILVDYILCFSVSAILKLLISLALTVESIDVRPKFGCFGLRTSEGPKCPSLKRPRGGGRIRRYHDVKDYGDTFTR